MSLIRGNYDVLTVCKYIVAFCHSKNIYLDNLKLQKLLYFIDAYFLVSTDGKEACFQEAICAWTYGPVVPEAYSAYKVFGSAKIMPEDSDIIQNESICKEHADMISFVVNDLGKYSGPQLVSVTHQQTPWKTTYADGDGQGEVIPKQVIYNYFK